MEYEVVEVKWSRDGNFVGTPPISHKQPQLTKILAGFARDGWALADIHHEVGDNLRFSIITLARDAAAAPSPSPRQPPNLTKVPVEIKSAPETQEPVETAPTATRVPLTNGLYVSVSQDENFISFLRFYEDGRVVSTSTEANAVAEKVAKWLTWENVDNNDDLYVDSGKYSVVGIHIEFATTSPEGTVEYSGSIASSTELDLHSHSLINGREDAEWYVFVEIASLS